MINGWDWGEYFRTLLHLSPYIVVGMAISIVVCSKLFKYPNKKVQFASIVSFFTINDRRFWDIVGRKSILFRCRKFNYEKDKSNQIKGTPKVSPCVFRFDGRNPEKCNHVQNQYDDDNQYGIVIKPQDTVPNGLCNENQELANVLHKTHVYRRIIAKVKRGTKWV